MIFGRTDLRIGGSRAKFDVEVDGEVRFAVALPKPHEINEKLILDPKISSNNSFAVEKRNVGNRLKRVFPKFGGCTGHV